MGGMTDVNRALRPTLQEIAERSKEATQQALVGRDGGAGTCGVRERYF